MKRLYSLVLIFILLVIFVFLNLTKMYSTDPKVQSSISPTIEADQPKSDEPSPQIQPNNSKEPLANNSSQKIDFESISTEHAQDLVNTDSSTDEKILKEVETTTPSNTNKEATDTSKLPLNISSIDQEKQKTETPSSSSAGLYPEASERILSLDDLANKSVAELKIMRNEIFARHSYIFTNPQMKEYFNKQPWYKGLNNNVYSLFSPIEMANMALIQQQEVKLGE